MVLSSNKKTYISTHQKVNLKERIGNFLIGHFKCISGNNYYSVNSIHCKKCRKLPDIAKTIVDI